MKRFKTAVLLLALSLCGVGAVGLQTAHALAPAPVRIVADSKGEVCGGLNELDSSQGCGANGSGVSNIVKTIVTIISYIVGIAGVIMVMVSGFRFITSGGDSGKVSSAKTGLVYALIGLAIAALAQALVHFVLNESAAAVKPEKTTLAPVHRLVNVNPKQG
jgi:hypothetical protein